MNEFLRESATAFSQLSLGEQFLWLVTLALGAWGYGRASVDVVKGGVAAGKKIRAWARRPSRVDRLETKVDRLGGAVDGLVGAVLELSASQRWAKVNTPPPGYPSEPHGG